jgi:hypothetical protein
MADNTEAPGPDEAHATTEEAETAYAPATTTQDTEAGVTTPPAMIVPAQAPDREEGPTRLRRSSAPSPESQVDVVEQHRTDLSRDSRRSPFDASRPYRKTSLEDADIDPDVGWQGPEVYRSRILGRRNHAGNSLRFGAIEESDLDENDDNDDEMPTEVEVTAETQWALEQAGLILVLLEYNNNDDDGGH